MTLDDNSSVESDVRVTAIDLSIIKNNFDMVDFCYHVLKLIIFIPDAVSREKDATFILLRVLNPHCNCKAISRSCVERNYLSGA